MTRAIPAIVVSLPAVTASEAREQVKEAQGAGADLAEIRFDLWSDAARSDAARLFPSPLPLIATVRSRAEGGGGPSDVKSRSEILGELARLPFRWVDLEADRDADLQEHLPPHETLGRIWSTHYPTGVVAQEWARKVREPVPPGCVRKVVAWARIGSLLTDLLPQLPPPGETATVSLTVGPSGPLLRAWSRRLGLPMVYAALPQRSLAADPRPPVEPSQIPVNHLRPFLAAEEDAPLFGLAGHPVAHTRSPGLHARWMARRHRAGLYVPLDFETETEFVNSLGTLAEWGFRGLNVTHPWKLAAIQAATDVVGGAAICGVANTLTFRGDEIVAENTDLAAILRRLEELKRSGRWDGTTLSVVGAGGSARSTLAAARTLGAQTTVYARRTAAAEEVAKAFGAEARAPSEARSDGLVVHATDVGRAGTEPLEIPIERLVRRGTHVLDWVYAPEASVIRDAVEARGATYEDGRRLLVYQAAASFGVWWGEEPDAEEIQETLRGEGWTE
jgi:shikimate dehydrogenase